ncbi:MAG: mechanosensitive ion channel family protein [Pyrobaculum sp.]|uniref:mechanosensitive ion channel domain-containing protein n=1 Tax=Pyrobaculum sp. TaxID=2004705 RepID=UPI003EE8DF08
MKTRLWAATVVKVAVVVAASVVAYYSMKFLNAVFNLGLTQETYGFAAAFIATAAGVIVSNIVGNALIVHLRPALKEKAFSVGNVVKLLGFFFSIIIAFTIAKIGAEVAVLGGTVTGLVLGLALQQVLGNLFAGLIILATRFITVGDVVRITSTGLPYQWAMLPAYKWFSPDYVVPGYKGRVVEIGLFYTTIILDMGQEMRIPNSIVLSSGVVDYTPQWSERNIVMIRLELPLSIIDFDNLEKEITEVLGGLKVLAVDYTEQSDKDYVILRIKIEVPEGVDWRAAKSEALKRLLKYRDAKIHEKFYRYACLTRGILCDKYAAEMVKSANS